MRNAHHLDPWPLLFAVLLVEKTADDVTPVHLEVVKDACGLCCAAKEEITPETQPVRKVSWQVQSYTSLSQMPRLLEESRFERLPSPTASAVLGNISSSQVLRGAGHTVVCALPLPPGRLLLSLLFPLTKESHLRSFRLLIWL